MIFFKKEIIAYTPKISNYYDHRATESTLPTKKHNKDQTI